VTSSALNQNNAGICCTCSVSDSRRTLRAQGSVAVSTRSRTRARRSARSADRRHCRVQLRRTPAGGRTLAGERAQKQKTKETVAERTVASVRRAGSTTDGKDAPRNQVKGLSRRLPRAPVLSNPLVVSRHHRFGSNTLFQERSKVGKNDVEICRAACSQKPPAIVWGAGRQPSRLPDFGLIGPYPCLGCQVSVPSVATRCWPTWRWFVLPSPAYMWSAP
jgi:hypothetical protein